MKVVVLGIPLPPGDNRWKDEMCEGGQELGWDVTHIPARGSQCSDVVRLCKGADIFIWAMTHGHNPSPPSSIPGMLRQIEAGGTRTVALHMDLYWGIPARERKIGRMPWWTCQFVFTADGGHQAEFFGRKVNHFWMPPAMGSQYSYRAEQSEPSGHLLYVGGYVPGIHGEDRGRLLEWARQQNGFHADEYGPAFAMFGRGEGSRGQVYGHRLNRLYAGAMVVLGDSAPSPKYWSDRVPCTLGRGGLLTHPDTEGFDEMGFTDEVMIRYTRGDLDELAERIYSLRMDEAWQMQENAIQLVRERHLWRHRMQDLQNIVMSDNNCLCRRYHKRLLGGCWCGR